MPFLRHSHVFLTLLAVGCAAPKPAPPVDAGYPRPTPSVAAKPTAPKVSAAPTFVRPKRVRGVYLTAWTATSKAKLGKMIDLLDRTELNALVIDVRDQGEVYFPIDDPMVRRVHEAQKGKLTAFKNPAPTMERLAKAGVYPIARIACFRDNYVPQIDPSRAVQTPDGKPWRDHSKHEWLDPYDKRNWDYLATIVDYAMDLGFPEIQLDYVRFPSEGKRSTQVFPNQSNYADPKAHKDDVITAFAEWMGKRVRARGRAFSADVFGIISSGTVDQGIGQTLEKIAAPFDALSPMIYPSHFAKGEYGIADPNASPYEIVHKSLADYKRRLPKTLVRPWLQGFPWAHIPYSVKEVRAQIKAAHDLGYDEYLVWNAGNRYSEEAYGKEKAVVSNQVAPESSKPSPSPSLRP